MNLAQLKAQAQALGITIAHASDYGLTNVSDTWNAAIADFHALQASYPKPAQTVISNDP